MLAHYSMSQQSCLLTLSIYGIPSNAIFSYSIEEERELQSSSSSLSNNHHHDDNNNNNNNNHNDERTNDGQERGDTKEEVDICCEE